MVIMSQVIQLPEEVSHLINIISERWGYYFGKRAIQSELMKATATERATVGSIGQSIAKKMNEYINEGKDVREDIRSLQAELVKARGELKAKAEPFYAKIAVLNTALSYLDKQVIPAAIEKATGSPVVPRSQVSDYILQATATEK
jgi:NAD-dependent DNA ligase